MLPFFYFSSLEQFTILPLIPLYFGKFDFSFTNETLVLLSVFLILFIYLKVLIKQSDLSFFIIPNYWQIVLEFIYTLILSTVLQTIKSVKAPLFFPLVLTIFLFLLCLNLIGFVPFCLTLTSHFIVCFSISFSVFIGINIVGIKTNGLNFIVLFTPSGINKFTAFLVTLIELVSHFSKPLSLAIRVCANLTGGHLILKLLSGLSFSLMSCTGFMYTLQLCFLTFSNTFIYIRTFICFNTAFSFLFFNMQLFKRSYLLTLNFRFYEIYNFFDHFSKFIYTFKGFNKTIRSFFFLLDFNYYFLC